MLTRRYVVASGAIKEPVTIALVTDTHSQRFYEGGLRIANAVRAAAPDIIVLGGDIVDNILPLTGTRELLSLLKGIAPLYYVPGNHDYFYRNLHEALLMLRSYGVRVIHDEVLRIRVRGNTLLLAGADDPNRAPAIDKNYNWVVSGMRTFLPLANERGVYKILVVHRPDYAEFYAGFGFDLMLSGHTHGGIWRFFPLSNGWYAPTQGFAPKYAGGEYHIGKTTLIVGRGLTTKRPGFPRFGNPTEVVIVSLVNKLTYYQRSLSNYPRATRHPISKN
jgi:predicted MPP superfamily phosphohydrolase